MHSKLSHSVSKKDLLRKYQAHQQDNQQLQAEALQEAQRLAAIMTQDFGASQVWLVGPLVYHRFQAGMPLEFVVAGLSPAQYLDALAHVQRQSALTVVLINLAEADSWTQLAMQNAPCVLSSGSGSNAVVRTSISPAAPSLR